MFLSSRARDLACIIGLSLLAPGHLGFAQPRRDEAIKPRVIYGEDNRLDLYEIEDPNLLLLASSTAAMVRDRMLTHDPISDHYDLQTQIFGHKYQLCEDEPFWHQPTGPICSAFLVGPDLLATAGHCVRTQQACETVRFVFDYGLFDSENEAPESQIPAANVYSCKTLIHSEVQVNSADFALLKLDRSVENRQPLKLNLQYPVERSTPLIVIGHPVGLPTKVAGQAQVRAVEEAHFSANLDTYGGNSGSAVFNAETREVEGILVRGARDFIERDGCRVSNVCEDDSCGGEDVTKIGALAPFLTSESDASN